MPGRPKTARLNAKTATYIETDINGVERQII
jgi:hypothetical protein